MTGLLFVGAGVSGGEEGARHGPAIMPGGSDAAWPHIKEILQKTAAQSDGEACCEWVGGTGSGHYVKMVHNGIEYGDMQLITEVNAQNPTLRILGSKFLLTSFLGIRHHEARSWHVQQGDGRRLCLMEQGRSRLLLDRDYSRHHVLQ